MNTGDRLKKHRESLGKNQSDVAWDMLQSVSKSPGAAQTMLSRIERAGNDILISDLKLAADYYGKPMSYFTGEGGGIEPPCGLVHADKVESICKRIKKIYDSGNEGAINSLECHLEGLVAMLTNREAVEEILNSLNVLMNDNQDFHRRLNTIDKDFKEIKQLIKTDDSDEKAVAGDGQGGAAVR